MYLLERTFVYTWNLLCTWSHEDTQVYAVSSNYATHYTGANSRDVGVHVVSKLKTILQCFGHRGELLC